VQESSLILAEPQEALADSSAVFVGLWASNKLVGTGNPEYFFALTGLLATPPTACAYWLISRRYRLAQHRERLFHAIGGWIVLFVSAGIMLAAPADMLPMANTSQPAMHSGG